MLTIRRAWRVLGIVVATALSGCAAAYHDDPDPCIPYAYCPPPPLPYATYAPCGCPTLIAAQYKQRTASKEVPDSYYVPSADPGGSATPGRQEPAPPEPLESHP
jgi:hypothetical protein